eukprot:593507_1
MTTLCGYCVHIIVLWFTHHRWRYVSAQSCNSTFILPIEAKGMQLGYTVDSNIVYLFGGMTGELANTPLSSIYKYNVNEDQYTLSDTSTPTTPFHTFSNNIVSVNDIMYFVGTPMFVNDPWPPNYAYAFDVATETWTVLSNPLNPAVYGCLTANDTHLFFIGGIMDANSMIIILNGIQTYDIVSNDWSYDTINDLPIDGWQLGYCAMMNDDIYVFGGEGADLEYLDIIYKWDGTWNNIGTLPQPLVYGIAVAHMDYIYIIGGMGSNYVPSRNIYVFDTTQDVITNTYQMVWGLEYPTAGVINNKLYIFGGLIATGGVSNDVKVCDILPTLPTQISTNPSRSPVLNPTNPTASPMRPTAAPIRPNTVDPTTSLQPTLAPSILPSLPPQMSTNPSKSPVVNSLHPTASPVNPTAAPLRLTTVDPTTSLLPTLAPIIITNATSLSTSILSTINPSPNESTKGRNATETYRSSISPTKVNINARHNSSDSVLVIVLILLCVVAAVVVFGLRCYCKRKRKMMEEEIKTMHMDDAHVDDIVDNKEDSRKIRAMMNNLSNIPHDVLVTTGGALEEIEGRQNGDMNKENNEQGEMRYTNEG